MKGDRIGLLNNSEILKLIESKTIDKQTGTCGKAIGLTNWLLVKQLPEILKLVALNPPPLPKNNYENKFGTDGVIAFGISIILSHMGYKFYHGENKILQSVGSFLFLSVSLILSLGLNFEEPRTTTNIKIVSIILNLVALTSNVIFNF